MCACRGSGTQLPVYVVTDPDPHGIGIAECYISSLPSCAVVWLGVRPTDLTFYFHVDEAELLSLTRREKTLCENAVSRLQSLCAQLPNLKPLVRELNALRDTGRKFELEALSSKLAEEGMSCLLSYIVTRVAEISVAE